MSSLCYQAKDKYDQGNVDTGEVLKWILMQAMMRNLVLHFIVYCSILVNCSL